MLIDRPWGVSATGHGTSRAEPDHAIVSFAINRLAGEPSAALDQAKTAASAARATLAANGVADEDIRSSQTNLHSIWDGHGASRRLVGHQCRLQLTARLGVLDAVGACLVDLVDGGADEILGITYDTTRQPELLAAARTQAVEDARAKATSFAAAAGIELGPVVHIEDAEAQHLGPSLARRSAMSAGDADGDPLLPGSVVVNAVVIVGFSIAG